ncbi:MAG: hypothetical protein RML84_09335 [Anaerolineae bacterium]|nr:hypothetical protein [Anaerolineae bacterium]
MTPRYKQRLHALLVGSERVEAYIEVKQTRYGLADARQVLLSPGVWQYAPYAGGVGGWIISRTPRPGAYRAECLGVHGRGNALVCEAIRLVERVA